MSLCWGCCPFVSEGQSHECTGDNTEKFGTRLDTLNRHLCSYANEWGNLMMPTSSFVLWEVVLPLSNALQQGELSLSVWPKGSSEHTAASGSLPSFFTGEPLHSSGSIWWWHRCLKLQILALLLVKTFIIVPLVFTVSGLGELFFFAIPCVLFYLSLILSLYLYHHNSFLPHITSLHLLSFTVDHFPFSSYSVCSFSLQINFMVSLDIGWCHSGHVFIWKWCPKVTNMRM